MTYRDCDLCGSKENPLNDTLNIDGKVHCGNCVETHYPENQLPAHLSVVFERDTTICSFCGKDYGSDILAQVAAYRACDACAQNMKNKAFPKWVKAFFIAILLITTGSFCWNWKYYKAYNDLKDANAFVDHKDLKNAAISMKSASEIVPEVPELATFAHYFKGLDLSHNEQFEKALAEFNLCGPIDEDYRLEYYKLEMKSTIAFGRQDYDTALKLDLEALKLEPEDVFTVATVAGAYACRYAVNGDAADLKNANDYLAKAKAIDNKTAEAISYYDLIEYRIQNRSTISNKEFQKKFPNGLTKN